MQRLPAFGDQRPMLLLVLANHKPGAKKLGELLRSMPPSPHADVYVATSSLVGYGLIDEAVLPVEQALERLSAVIG